MNTGTKITILLLIIIGLIGASMLLVFAGFASESASPITANAAPDSVIGRATAPRPTWANKVLVVGLGLCALGLVQLFFVIQERRRR